MDYKEVFTITIGERIRDLRTQYGWTQQELAIKAGYKDKTAISRIESSQNELNQSKIVKFAKILNVSPAYLMGWEDEEPETLANILSNPEIIKFALSYIKLNDTNKEFVRNTIEMLIKKQEND